MNKIALVLISILFVALLLGVTVVAIENITNATDNVTEDVIIEGVKIPPEIKKEDAENNIIYSSRQLDKIKSIITSVSEKPPVSVLLGEVEKHLENAINAFENMNYGESFGQSTSAMHLIDNAEKMLDDEPLIEIFSFEESIPENPLIPEGWYYLSPERIEEEWRTDIFSLNEESYFDDNSIFLNTYKTSCCVNSGYIVSGALEVDPNKIYYLEFYTKTNYTLYSTNKGNVGYHAYLLIYFYDSSNNLISEFYTEWNQTSISLENLGANPPSSELLEFSDTQNEWKKVRIKIYNLDLSIDNAKIMFSEYYPENSVNVLIDDILFFAG